MAKLVQGAAPMLTLHGKGTELGGSRHWGKKPQFLIQVSLEREPSGKTPAERYYCCGFYDGEEATDFRPVSQSGLRLDRIRIILFCRDGARFEALSCARFLGPHRTLSTAFANLS